MRRPTPPGTPSRSPRYMLPADGRRLFRVSLLVAAGALAVAVALYAVGLKGVASPGALAGAHDGIDTACTQCHQPAARVVDLRCERCHDPIDSRRFESAAHAAATGARAMRAAHIPPVECASCHADHGGRRRDLARVDDGRCGSCHRFGSFASHPEFAPIRAGHDVYSGIDFSHEIHLREVGKTGERCQACHVPTPDQRGFEPIAFDTHCARCHVQNGLLTLNGTDLLKSGFTPESVLPSAALLWTAPTRSARDERGRVTLERFRHRDPWTVAVAGRLTSAIAGAAVASEARRRGTEAARLTAVAQASSVSTLADADLTAWLELLERDAAVADRAAATPAAQDPTAGLDAVARLIDPSTAAAVGALRGARPNGIDPRLANPADPQAVEERRRELMALIDAISAHGGPTAERAASLRQRLSRIAASAPSAPPDTAASLIALDGVDQAVRAIEPAASATSTAQIRTLADQIRQTMSGGVPPAALEPARDQLLALLAALETRANPPQRARIADLRETIAMLAAGDTAALLGERRDRLRDRVALERALRAEHGRTPVDATVNRERAVAMRELQQMRAKDAPGPAAVLGPIEIEPARGKTALKGLLGACLPCHRLDEDEAAMRPVRAGRPVLAATFSHKPHTIQAACDTCHAVATSRAGIDVNLPTVASCRTCHDGGRARADCASCHNYHPRSAAELVVASR